MQYSRPKACSLFDATTQLRLVGNGLHGMVRVIYEMYKYTRYQVPAPKTICPIAGLKISIAFRKRLILLRADHEPFYNCTADPGHLGPPKCCPKNTILMLCLSSINEFARPY